MSRFQPENTAAGAAAPARARSAARSSSPRPPAASAAGPGRCGRRTPAAGTGRRAGPRSAPRTGRRTRAAASSMASGMPSSVRHSRATAPVLPAPSVNPGRTAAARAANSRIASCWARSPASRSVGRGRERRAAAPATRSRRAPAAAPGWWRPRAAPGSRPSSCCTSSAHGVHEVLAGIEDQQHPPRPQRLGQRLGQRPVRLLPDPERGRDPPRDQRRVRRCRPARPARRRRGSRCTISQASRSASLVLPMPPGPAQGQHADIAEQPGQLGQITLPADEAVRLGREVSVAQHGLSSHGPSVMVAVTRQFVTPAPPARSHGPEPGFSRYAAPPAPTRHAGHRRKS